MTRPYDVTGKDLLEIAPEAWLDYLGRPRPAERVRVIDSDVSTVSMAADKVIRIEDQDPWILHVELQSSRDTGLLPRILTYHALLRHRHGIPVATVLILLREIADGPELTGELRLGAPLGREWNFRYELIRLWRQPVDPFLNGPPALLPFAPLTQVDEASLPTVLSRMGRRLEQEVARPFAEKLWQCSTILLGMRFSSDVIEQAVQAMIDTSDSLAWEVLEKLAGQMYARKTILRQGSKRFGTPTAATEAALNAIKDQARLDAILDRIHEVASWDDLLAGE